MRRVLLGTPAYGSEVTAQFFFAFSETLRLCLANDIDLRPLLPTNDIVTHARNKLIHSAIQYNFDDLVFIDADQDWKAADFLRLLSHPVACVGAPVRKKRDDAELYNVRTKTGPRSIITDPATGLMTSADMCVGTGFLRLSREAVQALWAKAEPYKVWGDNEEYRWVFDFRPMSGELMSEDTLMCEKLRACGIPVWLDPAIAVGHWGSKCYAGDFPKWLGEQSKAHLRLVAVGAVDDAS